MEWKMEWNSEPTELQLTRVTGTTQSRLNYLLGSVVLVTTHHILLVLV